jgi:mannose-6-phosphate isomerase-like protein (cupin superfamily)
MIVRSLRESKAFRTLDGSEIRSILDTSNAPVLQQSLAEATLQPGASTQRHKHPQSEEFYFLTQGQGRMDLEGEIRLLEVGDAVLIPAGAAHQISCTSSVALKMLCACAPAYRHEDTVLLEP